MSFARVVALVVLVGLACWMIWPSHPATSAERGDSPRANKSAGANSFHGTGPLPALSVDPSAERIRVEGIVVDEQKAPIGGATVRLGSLVTTAEADGSFDFEGVAAGDVIVRAERGEWYGEESTTVDATSDPIEVVARRGSTLVLHVVARAGGAPIANAKVEIAGREMYTNEAGMIRARGLDPTGERFTVSADGFGTWRGDLELDTEHPTAEKEMTVTLASGAPIKGIVVDERGERVPEASVSISAVDNTWHDVVSANERGEFTIPAIATGKHTIHASSDIHLAKPEQLITHDGVHPTTGIVVHVSLGAELAGRVVDGAGNPVAGASIRGVSGPDTDADGRFLAKGLDPGEVTLSAYIDSRSSFETKVTVAVGKRTEVVFVIRDSSIAGRVVDKTGAVIPEASLWAKATDESNTFFATSDEYGAFDFGGMPPGDYLVIAQHDEEANRRLPEEGTVVRTGTRDLTVVLPALATVTGRVVLDGTPVPYYGVIITKTPDTLYSERTTTVTSDAGTFAQKDIAPGTWSVVILGPGFATKIIDGVVARDGSTTDLGTIAVDRGRVVRGRVTDARGQPVAGALVIIGESLFSIANNRVDQRAQGDATVRTDASGRFELAGITSSDTLKIVARTSTAVSPERELAPTDTIVDLVIAEVGTVVGHISNMKTPLTSVIASQPSADGLGDARYYGDIDRAGDFRLTNLPPGRYEIEVMGDHALRAQTIDVIASSVVRVDFELPTVQIEITIRADKCHLISLDGPNAHAIGSCNANTIAWKAVAPGSYNVCTSDGACVAIDVARSPAEQAFDVRFPEVD